MNGILIIDKPPGITSHDVVKRVKRMLKVRKAGHTGTLDPLATGVLPVCINEATKIVQFLINDDKEYEAELRLGIETDTQDNSGRVIKESCQIPEDHNKIIDTIMSFEGNIKQKPPVFSALKHHGTPLYKLARKGVCVDTEEREVQIFKINITRIDLPYISFLVSCSKGTYIRTLCADIGKRLGCGAHLVRLKRIRSGSFDIKDSHSLDEIETLAKNGTIKEKVVPLDKALNNLPQIKISDDLAERVRHGKQIIVDDLRDICLSHIKRGESLRITSSKNDLIAVGESLINSPLTEKEEGRKLICRLVRVFNT
ncbi:MAG: tRNA pseudouridine(55) synthase TruB [Pseudomonadota bacterium]